jgi:hypothetical protein
MTNSQTKERKSILFAGVDNNMELTMPSEVYKFLQPYFNERLIKFRFLDDLRQKEFQILYYDEISHLTPEMLERIDKIIPKEQL